MSCECLRRAAVAFYSIEALRGKRKYGAEARRQDDILPVQGSK
jgi:hypothetical protein